ncbi:hypothetical protein [Plasmodium yoelii yoelii]|uniref:Uncharacterized protein n=1 Tax=Plasmodium yoelii yoelii TaxID=73239 RepID=Q7R876_PLAYO|nr:hypothetical protein [Plasmodium yoelii yoelii]
MELYILDMLQICMILARTNVDNLKYKDKKIT